GASISHRPSDSTSNRDRAQVASEHRRPVSLTRTWNRMDCSCRRGGSDIQALWTESIQNFAIAPGLPPGHINSVRTPVVLRDSVTICRPVPAGRRLRPATGVVQSDILASFQDFRLSKLARISCCDEQPARNDCGEKARSGKELHARPRPAIIKCVDRNEFAGKFMTYGRCGPAIWRGPATASSARENIRLTYWLAAKPEVRALAGCARLSDGAAVQRAVARK